VQGALRGLTAQTLSLIGLAAGAFAGSRLAGEVLAQGEASPWLPVLSLAGAAIGAVLLQMLVGLVAAPLVKALSVGPLRLVDAAGGAVVGAAVGLGLAWLLGVVALHQPGLGLRAAVQRSTLVPALVSAIPPDRVLRALERFDPLPVLPRLADVRLPAPDASVLRSAGARTARQSVVKILGRSCGLGVQGSGWVVRSGLVATNAHVVAGESRPHVLAPSGQRLRARPVYVDAANDVALLRVAGLRARPLGVVEDPPAPLAVVVVGYPRDGPLTAVAGTAGDARRVLAPGAYGGRPRLRAVVPLRARVEPGDSGGPVLDRRGRTVAMVFGKTGARGGLAVPVSIVLDGLDEARRPVDPGPCLS
jgi:S1-C subfamily serine protease